MKVALVKQQLDSFGPWESVCWSEGNELRLAERWPTKATYWELTCLLQADWYVIPQVVDTDYIRDAVYKHAGRREMIERNTRKVVSVNDIPFDNYDLVISMDPILRNVYGKAVFAYFCQEHWDTTYRRSLGKPKGAYDLFLDHMLVATSTVAHIPQSVSFPYLRAPETVRSLFNVEKDESVWVDWRTLTTLSMTDLWDSAAEQAAVRLQDLLSVPIVVRGHLFTKTYGLDDKPQWGDFLRYYSTMGRCKYYVSIGRASGAGQAAGDAASLNCIVFGESDKAYHRLICHPACLCESMRDLPRLFKRVSGSTDLQAEVRSWQDRALHERFAHGPLGLLTEATRLKHLTVV